MSSDNRKSERFKTFMSFFLDLLPFIIIFSLMFGFFFHIVSSNYNDKRDEFEMYDENYNQPFLKINDYIIEINADGVSDKQPATLNDGTINEQVYLYTDGIDNRDGMHIVGHSQVLGLSLLEEVEKGSSIYLYNDNKEYMYRLIDIYESDNGLNPKVYEQELKKLNQNDRIVFEYLDEPNRLVVAKLFTINNDYSESSIANLKHEWNGMLGDIMGLSK